VSLDNSQTPTTFTHSLTCSERVRLCLKHSIMLEPIWQMHQTSTIQSIVRLVTRSLISNAMSQMTYMRLSVLSTYGNIVTPRQTEQDSICSHSALLFLHQIRGVTLPKQQCLELRPGLCTSPMLAKHVSGIDSSRNVDEEQRLGSDRFSPFSATIAQHAVCATCRLACSSCSRQIRCRQT
jgi:hypothetical protein